MNLICIPIVCLCDSFCLKPFVRFTFQRVVNLIRKEIVNHNGLTCVIWNVSNFTSDFIRHDFDSLKKKKKTVFYNLFWLEHMACKCLEGLTLLISIRLPIACKSSESMCKSIKGIQFWIVFHINSPFVYIFSFFCIFYMFSTCFLQSFDYYFIAL